MFPTKRNTISIHTNNFINIKVLQKIFSTLFNWTTLFFFWYHHHGIATHLLKLNKGNLLSEKNSNPNLFSGDPLFELCQELTSFFLRITFWDFRRRRWFNRKIGTFEKVRQGSVGAFCFNCIWKNIRKESNILKFTI